MAWDDTPPDATGQAATSWDATPPTPDELKPSYLEDVGSNAFKEIKAIPGSLLAMANQALGVASAPMDVLKAIPEMMTGTPPAETNIAQDIKPIAPGVENTVQTIAHPVESFRKAPINTAGTALGLMGIPELMKDVPPRVNVPHKTIPEAPPEGPAGPAGPAGSAETIAEVPKDLPVMQPGVKEGPPHALFAYNDQFGPGGTSRSLYNIFGDPSDPKITAAGGYGSSVTKDVLDKAGIPVMGREPRSVGKWEPISEAAKPVEPPPGGPPPATPKPNIFENAAQYALKQANEVKDYISRGYQGFAKKPGAVANLADWVQEKSQMMAAQQLGVTPNQARQLGKTPLEAHNAMRAIGQYALDHDIVSPGTGLQGMLEKNADLQKSVGKTLGDFRKTADKLAGEVDPKEMVEAVRQELDQKYMRGVTEESGPRGAYGGQAGAYQRALQELEDAGHSHSGIAEAATELNHAANKAAKNMQPETPFTDVANAVSHLNNARIKELLGPEKAAQYEQALREFGVNKKIANALKFKSSGEVKRFGPGSIGSNLTQKAMDELGYRFGAKAANKLSTSILNKPSVAATLPSLFKEFINQVEDLGHDVTGMAAGGVVPEDVRQWIGSRSRGRL